MFDLRKYTDEYYLKRDSINAPYHQHKKGEIGASNLLNCNKIGAMEFAGKPFTKKTGLKAKKGALYRGTDIHEKIQSMHSMNEYGNYVYESEVYVRKKILDAKNDGYDLEIYSPIDESIIKPNEFGESVKYTTHAFRDIIGDVLELKEGAEFIQIGDIKSAGDYSFKLHRKEPSIAHDAQMQFYLQATGLNEMKIDYYSKSNTDSYSHVIKKDDGKWNEIKEKKKRQLDLSKTLEFEKYDLDYFVSPDANYICKYCSESECKDEIDDEGNEKLVFIRPCKEACEFAKSEAKRKFTYGSKWKRGRSHITIRYMNESSIPDGFDIDEIVCCTNKSGRMYIDTIYYALLNYEVFL